MQNPLKLEIIHGAELRPEKLPPASQEVAPSTIHSARVCWPSSLVPVPLLVKNARDEREDIPSTAPYVRWQPP